MILKLESIATQAQLHCGPIIDDENATHAWINMPLKDRSAAAAFALGKMHLHGFVNTNLLSALKWFHKAARAGHRLSQAIAAKLVYDLSSHDEFPEAQKWLEEAASHGSKSALAQLGLIDKSKQKTIRQDFQANFWACAFTVADDYLVDANAGAQSLISLPSGGPPLDTALFAAVLHSDAQRVRQLVDQARDTKALPLALKSRWHRGETLILLASRIGNADIVRQLLETGADASQCNELGENALHWLSSFHDDDDDVSR
jgi:hypothetical protein